MRTRGDLYPRLRTLPGYGAVASGAWSAPAPIRTDPSGSAGVERWLAAPSPRRGGKVRASVAALGCFLGGAERWISALLDWCDRERIEWAGVAYLDPANGASTAPTVRADWNRHCPISEGADAMRRLAADSEVMISWGVSTSQFEHIVAPGYPLVQVSHSALDLDWVHQMAGFPGSTSAACSRAALRGLAPDRRATSPVILNAVDPARVARTMTRADQLARWGLEPAVKVMGYLGRISEEKRPERIVEAAAMLPPEWRTVMVGSGLARASTIALAGRIAPGRVIFPDPITGPVGDALGAFDVHVMATRSEACSLGAAETWLAGVPLISTPVGLLEEFPGLARLIPADPSGEDIARAVLEQSSPQLEADRRVAVANARAFAETELSPSRFGREWTDLIVAKARPTPRPSAGLSDVEAARAVAACPDRGSVLPVSLQPQGCRCGELSECRAGRGKVAGRVSLKDCLACVRSRVDAHI